MTRQARREPLAIAALVAAILWVVLWVRRAALIDKTPRIIYLIFLYGGERVRAILKAETDNGFTVEDLCERVYGADEKKHRVSMLRVVKRISEAEPRYALMRSELRGNTLVLYDCTSAHAYGMARLKADSLHRYLAKSGYTFGTEARLLDELQRHSEVIAEGGTWWRFARMEWLRRSGENADELAALEAAHDRAVCAHMRDLESRMSGEPPPEDQARQAARLLMRYFERTGNSEINFTNDQGAVYLKAQCFQSGAGSDKETEESECFQAEPFSDKETSTGGACDG